MSFDYINALPKKFEPIKVQELDACEFVLDKNLELIAANGKISSFGYSRLIAIFDRAEVLLREGKKVTFVFHHTEIISLDALAFILGNIEYLINTYGRNKIDGTYSKSPLVNQFLIDCGFFERIGAKNKGGISQDDADLIDKKINLKFISGRFVNADSIAPFREQVINKEIVLEKSYDKKIFRALSEAMLNVHHHAYEGVKFKIGKYSTIKGRWWLGGSFLKENGQLSLVMYDIGSGIPSTMPRNYKSFVESFSPKGEVLDDAELLFLATQRGKTSTNKGHRGRGIPDMHQIVQNGNGVLQIVSGYGFYNFNGLNAVKSLLPLNCRGTLVVWSIFTKNLQV